MTALQPDTGDRIKSAIAAVALQLLLGYALVTGLAVSMPGAVDDGLKLFEIAPDPPPPTPKPIPPPVRSKRPEGAASPPNLRAKATEIVAPPPIIVTPVPSPVIASLTPGIGSAPFSGNADVRGPGTGSGGQGTGTGSGGVGDGDGGGGDESPPRWRRGGIRDSDYPEALHEAGIGGTVSVAYTVEIDGRVGDCDVTRSSGNALLDATTCRLIRQRFRFEPSRDGRGRPVPSTIVENHEWVVENLPPERER